MQRANIVGPFLLIISEIILRGSVSILCLISYRACPNCKKVTPLHRLRNVYSFELSDITYICVLRWIN
jgi:hypothetical protein